MLVINKHHTMNQARHNRYCHACVFYWKLKLLLMGRLEVQRAFLCNDHYYFAFSLQMEKKSIHHSVDLRDHSSQRAFEK